jgi:hypothetical protein
MHWVDALYYPQLVARLGLLDRQLGQLADACRESHSPDAEGILDDVEAVVGEGLFHCQHYMGQRKRTRRGGFRCGPTYRQQYVAEVINAGANYWKHVSEWPAETELEDRQRRTLEVIRNAGGASQDYPLSDLLHAISPDARLSGLLPFLEHWRETLDGKDTAPERQAAP